MFAKLALTFLYLSALAAGVMATPVARRAPTSVGKYNS